MTSNKLSLLEQETIILFNRQEAEANIYTHDMALKRKLYKLSQLFPEIMLLREDNGFGGVTYSLPKSLISVRPPREKKILSEDEKKAFRKRLGKDSSGQI